MLCDTAGFLLTPTFPLHSSSESLTQFHKDICTAPSQRHGNEHVFTFTALYTALQNQEEPKLHSPQMAKLNACVRKTPGRFTTEIIGKMKDNYSISLSIPTAKHCLKDAGLHRKRPAKKPFILGKNQKL
jgi:hypothetical protein